MGGAMGRRGLESASVDGWARATRQTRRLRGRAVAVQVVVCVVFAVPGLALARGPAAAVSGSRTFSYSGSAQTFTVPAGVTSLDVEVSGAQGGGTYGGFGARVRTKLSVTAGVVLQINVGGQGGVGLAGWNGGGGASIGGGGASDIRSATGELAGRIVVAGGGGGNGTAADGFFGAGGSAGTNGENGIDGSSGGFCLNAAAGGVGATPTTGFTLGSGEDGPTPTSDHWGGAGGGGFYGGFAGGAGHYCAVEGGGGAGSSYAGTGTSAVTVTRGWQLGNGLIRIAWPSLGAQHFSSARSVFTFSGHAEVVRVPSGSSHVLFEAFGAQGGGFAGGTGAVVAGVATVEPGRPIVVFAGGTNAGFNGGGVGGSTGNPTSYGGGGGTDIRIGGWAAADRVVVAGGGGGAGGGATVAGIGAGGAAAAVGAQGENGSPAGGLCQDGFTTGGAGATQSAGYAPVIGEPGDNGAGGGGGYYGGFRGRAYLWCPVSGGGGGGSSYISPAIATGSYATGVVGDGIACLGWGSAPQCPVFPFGAGQQPLVGGALTAAELAGGNRCFTCWGAWLRTAFRGDPVDTSTGAFTESLTDLTLAGRGPTVAMTRSYSSTFAAQNGPLGYGWSTPWTSRLTTEVATGKVTISQENGAEVYFTRNSDGSYSAAPRVIATLKRNTDGTYLFTRAKTLMVTFTAGGVLSALRDLNGNVVALHYTAGLLDTVTAASGRRLKLTWLGSHIANVSDDLGRTTKYEYNDGNGNLTDVIDAFGGHTTYGYNGSHHLTSILDPRQFGTASPQPIVNAYDAEGRVTSQTDQLGRVTAFQYLPGSDSSHTKTLTIDPAGHAILDQFSFGLRTAETRGYGTSLAVTHYYVYDPATLGVISSATVAPGDPNTYMTSATYDLSGQPRTETDGLGRTTTFTYNSLQQPLAVTTPNPSTVGPATVTTTYRYDTRGNLLSETSPLYSSATAFTNWTTTYHHDDAAHPDDVTSTTDPTGATSAPVYAASGDVIRSTTPLGNATTFSYDAVGHRKAMVSPRGNATGASPAAFTTTYTYDAFDRLTSTTVANGSTPLKSFSLYDLDGNLGLTVDGHNHWTVNKHDFAKQLVETDRPDGTKLAMTYWPDGNLQQRFDGANQPTSYDYDPLGRTATMTDPLNRTTQYTYNGQDQPAVETQADGSTITNSYDNGGQLTLTDYSDPATPDVTYTYGPTGLRSTMIDGTGTSTYTYDSLGRLTAHRDGSDETVTDAYNLRGDRIRLTYPGTPPVTQTYDADGRLTQVIDWNNHATRFRYDANGNLTETSYPNGVVSATTLDNADQTAKITDTRAGTTLANWTYAHDSNAQLTSDAHTGIPGANETYTYTTLDQLKNVNATTYGYDTADNLTKTPTSRQTFDTGNQLCWTAPTPSTNPCATAPSGATVYSYDQRGNRTSRATGSTSTTNAYDEANRLTSYSSGTVTATYRYDGDNLRSTRTVNGNTHTNTWDVAVGLPLLLTDNATKIIYGPGGLPIEQINGTTVTYLQHDRLGSVRIQTNAAGIVTATRSYQPYGKTSSTTGTFTSILGYNSQSLDSESGYLYLRARYYDPQTGQFLTRDPLVTQTEEAYSYVEADPLNSVDPLGLSSCGFSFGGLVDCVAKAGAAAADLAQTTIHGDLCWKGSPNCSTFEERHYGAVAGIAVVAAGALAAPVAYPVIAAVAPVVVKAVVRTAICFALLVSGISEDTVGINDALNRALTDATQVQQESEAFLRWVTRR